MEWVTSFISSGVILLIAGLSYFAYRRYQKNKYQKTNNTNQLAEHKNAEIISPHDLYMRNTTWVNDIAAALKNLGGVAAYDDIYKEVARLRGTNLPDNWQAIIRGRIEENSRGNGKDIFFSAKGIGSGVWGLKAFKAVETESPDNENEIKPPQLPKAIEPLLRGGRLHGVAGSSNILRPTRPSDFRFDIICWLSQRQWFIGVEIPEEIYLEPFSISLDGKSLNQAHGNNRRFPLDNLKGNILVKGQLGEAHKFLHEDDALLFKLGSDLDHGRLVSSASRGWYLIIAPKHWKNKENEAIQSDLVNVALSNSLYKGYMVNFENLGYEDEPVVFDVLDKSFSIGPEPKFGLTGEESIFDAGQDRWGAIFSSPPKITCVNRGPEYWNEISAIILGEEGSTWRKEITPDPTKSDQDIPGELKTRQAGCFFLRFYNRDKELVDSMVFRFAQGLRYIKQPLANFLPQEDGHKDTSVDISHEMGIVITPVDNSSKHISVQEIDNGTRLVIPPNVRLEHSLWELLEPNGNSIYVSITIEAIWWTIIEDGKEPNEWQDTLIDLDNSWFKATSQFVLWLHVPKHFKREPVYVGLEHLRPFRLKALQTNIPISLGQFYDDFQNVRQRRKKPFLKVSIINGAVTEEAIIAKPPNVIINRKVAEVDDRIESRFGRYASAESPEGNFGFYAEPYKGSGRIWIDGLPLATFFDCDAKGINKTDLERLIEFEKSRNIPSNIDFYIRKDGNIKGVCAYIFLAVKAFAKSLYAYDSTKQIILRQSGLWPFAY